MKKIFIFTTAIVMGLLTYSDLHDRLDELDRLSKTQSQIEFKRDILKPANERMNNFPDKSNKNHIRQEKLQFNYKLKQKNPNNSQHKHEF